MIKPKLFKRKGLGRPKAFARKYAGAVSRIENNWYSLAGVGGAAAFGTFASLSKHVLPENASLVIAGVLGISTSVLIKLARDKALLIRAANCVGRPRLAAKVLSKLENSGADRALVELFRNISGIRYASREEFNEMRNDLTKGKMLSIGVSIFAEKMFRNYRAKNKALSELVLESIEQRCGRNMGTMENAADTLARFFIHGVKTYKFYDPNQNKQFQIEIIEHKNKYDVVLTELKE